jgi:DNA polymerase III subunit delta'
MNKGTGVAAGNNWGLIGHEWAVEMLQQHIAHDSLRHAYLITVPSGVGRRTLALRLAQALECPLPISKGVPCGKCRTCRQIESMKYPDLTVLQAEKEGGVLKVEQVRQLRQQIVLTPFQGKYRVALLLRFHEANPSAYNALLKTLEEAPAQAILLLTADTAEGLPPTIVSRCEVLRLRPLPVEQVESALKERGANPEQAHLLAHLSGGRPGAAFRLMEDASLLQFRKERLDDLQSLLRASRVEKFTYAGKLFKSKDRDKDKENFRDILLLWLAYWRDVLVCISGSSSPLVNVDREEEISLIAGKLDLPAARRLVKGMEIALGRLERNINPKLLAEVLLLDQPKVEKYRLQSVDIND